MVASATPLPTARTAIPAAVALRILRCDRRSVMWVPWFISRFLSLCSQASGSRRVGATRLAGCDEVAVRATRLGGRRGVVFAAPSSFQLRAALPSWLCQTAMSGARNRGTAFLLGGCCPGNLGGWRGRVVGGDSYVEVAGIPIFR